MSPIDRRKWKVQAKRGASTSKKARLLAVTRSIEFQKQRRICAEKPGF